MRVQMAISKALIIAVVLAFGGATELAQAWQQQGPEGQPSTTINGTTVNPSQVPLTPLPSAPEPQQTPPAPQEQPQPQSQPAPTTQMEQKQPATEQEPLGTAAAEQVPANGGGASRPAGTAIAPAKQHQTRSLFLKLGAVAAAGIAIGTVAALSKGTPSH